MLLSFSIENFKGIFEPVRIFGNSQSMDDDDRSHPVYCRLQKDSSQSYSIRMNNTIAIWGANLSGKSTLVEALQTIQNAILNRPFDYCPNTFFGEDKPTKLGIEFIRPKDGVYRIFEYRVEYDASGILEEHLWQIDEDAYDPRLSDECTYAYPGATKTKNANPYLHEIKTFDKCQPDKDATGASKALIKFAKHMFFVPKDTKTESAELLQVANLPMKQSYHLLQELKLFDPSLVSLRPCQGHLEFVHDISEHARKKKTFSEESESFRTFANLMGAIESAANRGGIVIADDIDSLIHPVVLSEVMYLLSLQNFYNLAPMQLFATFKNTTNMDWLHMRKDSVWFLQYTHPYRTLFCLSEYKEKPEEFLWLSYLQGKYGWTVPELPLAFGRDGRI